LFVNYTKKNGTYTAFVFLYINDRSLYKVEAHYIPGNSLHYELVGRLQHSTIDDVNGKNLVVFAIRLTLGIQDSTPVVGFEVGLSVHINLDLNEFSGLLDRVSWDTNGGEGSTDQFTNSRWAPFSDDISSLQIEFGSKDRILDGSVIIDFAERKWLVDRRALVSKGVDRSLRVNGNADSKSSSNTGSGGSRGRKILNRDARNIFKGRLELGHVQGGARLWSRNDETENECKKT
jgi:hypothetical protein